MNDLPTITTVFWMPLGEQGDCQKSSNHHYLPQMESIDSLESTLYLALFFLGMIRVFINR